MKALILLAALYAVLNPLVGELGSKGQAATSTVPPMEKYERVAERIWGLGEDERQPDYVWLTTAEMTATISANTAGFVYDNDLTTIYLDGEWFLGEIGKYRRCTLIVHEWGHTIGLRHEDAEFKEGVQKSWRLCTRKFARGWWR